MKWITIQGRDREGKGLYYLIHGAHDLQEGDRALVFPSTDRRIPYAVAKGLDISPGTRVVAVPHSKMPWSRIRTSVFANDSIPPTANFVADPTYGYQPLTVSFTDISYANPPIYAWHWDFGDGTSSTAQNPVHTYQGLGWFNVTLTVTNGLGSDTIRREALIFSGVDHPLDLRAWRAEYTTAMIYWVPGANNTQVVITRRDDFYPPHPNNAVRVYYGAAGGGPITDSGLQAGKEYYYRIWGIRDGVLSEGYRSAVAGSPLPPTSTIKVTSRDWRRVAYVGEVIDYGPFVFVWNGQGTVWLSGSSSQVTDIIWDNEIRISTEYGTFGWHSGPQMLIPEGSVSKETIEITPLLRIGENVISIQIRDTLGAWVGAYSDIYIVQRL